MTQFVRFITLEDALALLNELHGLPNIPASAFRRHRLIRASIILSWVAVEEVLSGCVDLYSLAAYTDFPESGKLLQQIEYAAKANGKVINIQELARSRRLRNDMTHARDDEALGDSLTEGNCQFVFDTCLAAIRAMRQDRVACSLHPL
jgi:hypothetical protein